MRVRPRASRDRLEGERGGALLVRVTRPPADGAANDAVVSLLARELRVPAGTIKILKGASSRDKLLLFDGLSPRALLAGLARS